MRCQCCRAVVQCQACGAKVADTALRVRQQRRAKKQCYDCGKPLTGRYTRCSQCRLRIQRRETARRAKAAAA